MSSLNTGVPSSQDTDTVGTDMEFEILCKCMHADKLSHKSITCKAYLQAILASSDLFFGIYFDYLISYKFDKYSC